MHLYLTSPTPSPVQSPLFSLKQAISVLYSLCSFFLFFCADTHLCVAGCSPKLTQHANSLREVCRLVAKATSLLRQSPNVSASTPAWLVARKNSKHWLCIYTTNKIHLSSKWKAGNFCLQWALPPDPHKRTKMNFLSKWKFHFWL